MITLIGADFGKQLIPLIDEAKKNIEIVSYDWRWYADQNGHPVQQFNMAIVRAVQRGVLVRAVLNSSDLLPLLTKLNIRARCMKDKRTLHAKMILIDGKTLVIGSHNITRNAFTHNVEVSVVVEIPPEVTRLAEFFENLYNI